MCCGGEQLKKVLGGFEMVSVGSAVNPLQLQQHEKLSGYSLLELRRFRRTTG